MLPSITIESYKLTIREEIESELLAIQTSDRRPLKKLLLNFLIFQIVILMLLRVPTWFQHQLSFLDDVADFFILALYGLGALFVVCCILWVFIVKSWKMHNGNAIYRPRLIFSGEGIEIHADGHMFKGAWSILSNFREARTTVLFKLEGSGDVAIPRRCLSPEALAALRQMFLIAVEVPERLQHDG